MQSLKNVNIIRFGMWLLVVLLFFTLLYLGEGLLVPLVLAIFIFYLINILADTIARVPIGKFRMPRVVAVIMAILVIIVIFNGLINLLTRNINELRNKWPDYQNRLQTKADQGFEQWEKMMRQLQALQPLPEPQQALPGLDEAEETPPPEFELQPSGERGAFPRFAPRQETPAPPAVPGRTPLPGMESEPSAFSQPTLGDLVAEVRVTELLTRTVQTLTGTIGFTGLMVIYLMFLFIEQRSFDQKLHALLGDNPKRSQEIIRILQQIDNDIRKYLGVKTFTSAATGIISYIVMRAVDLSFAEFWAVLIFLLNFIPSIGSIIATIFPTILALVDADTLWPFLVVGGGITSLQFAIGNIIEPRLMGNTLNLSPLIILLSLALWGTLWGIPGAVLCVPITVICTIVCSYFPATRPIAILLSKNGELKNVGYAPETDPATSVAQSPPEPARDRETPEDTLSTGSSPAPRDGKSASSAG